MTVLSGGQAGRAAVDWSTYLLQSQYGTLNNSGTVMVLNTVLPANFR